MKYERQKMEKELKKSLWVRDIIIGNMPNSQGIVVPNGAGAGPVPKIHKSQ